MTDPPEPPVNVRVQVLGGPIVAVSTAYLGVEDGQHCWAVIDPPTGRICRAFVEVLPPNAVLEFPWPHASDPFPVEVGPAQ